MTAPLLAGRKVAVYGLAKSGLAAIRLLLREQAHVTAVDKAPREQLGATADALERDGVRLCLAQDPRPVLRDSALVVVSPGVPLSLPELEEARGAGVPVWGEVELAWRFLPPAPLLGITGTNGKSTTTALTGALFAAAGRRVFVGGNLGLPLSEAALDPKPYDAYVVELSSFQLEGALTLRCTGAAVLNLTPDHLDRYPSHAAYGAAKARIFRNQGTGDYAVINADDAEVMALGKQATTPRFGFAVRPVLNGRVMAEDDARASHKGEPTDLDELGLAGLAVGEGDHFSFRGEQFVLRNHALRGAHNLQNAMAATLLARLSGVEAAAIQQGLDQYPGLPHRLELVAQKDGVEWINDSKATNVDSSLVALQAFPKNLWLILGGKGKGAPYQPLVEASRGKVKGVLTIGKDAETIARAYAGVLPVLPCGTLEGAVRKAKELAVAGDVVLLSPACASYDQFKNFEHRGDSFKALVRELA